MTQLNLGTGGDIPSNCNTVERSFAWHAQLLKSLNPGAKIILAPDSVINTPAIDVALIKAHVGGYRLAVQAYIPVSDSYATNAAKFWENMLEIDEVAIPSNFKAN